MIIQGDALEKLRERPAGIADMCVTSPPYYGLRDYLTATWIGGSEDCDHKIPSHELSDPKRTGTEKDSSHVARYNRTNCYKCGAIMIARLEALNIWLQENIAIEKYERAVLEKAFRLILFPNERRILELKYLENLSWSEVAEEMYGKLRNYQINADCYLGDVYRTHRRALLHVEVATTGVNWMNLKN